MKPGILIIKKISENILRLILLFVFSLFFTPKLKSQVFINEFLASNVINNPDNHDYDDYSDWLELYNAGEQPVDLSGYFLTDNLNRPTRWQIPQGTVIEPKGFLLFWADGMDDIPGQIHYRPWTIQANRVSFKTLYYHTNFKISQG